jgi:hypothetical protein
MTNPMTLPLDDVRGLIEERERYDTWLVTLEARREATPAHVFERVRSDYDSRLRSVAERLVEGLVPLRDAEARLAARESELTRGLSDRQDELAELELRTLVGEFPADEGERRVQEAASVVRDVDGERRATVDELHGLRALLARADTAPRSGGGAGVGAAATAASAATQQEPRSPTPMQPAPAIAPSAVASSAASPEAPAFSAPAAEEVETPAWSPTPRPQRNDEEGFVGTGQRIDALAASLGGSTATQPANASIASGQEKTLRCQDCGEMNYPTEWYCERCGGELAAL